MAELMELIEDWRGYTPVGQVDRGEDHERRLMETMDLLTNARRLPQHRHEYQIREAMTTSDFPILFGEVLDRQVLAAYKAVLPVWTAFVRPSTLKDFRVGHRLAINGGNDMLDKIPEKGEYLASKVTETKFDVQVFKYGRQFDISWESLVNDDLGALRDFPARLAMAAVRTEHRTVTDLYANDTGTHAAGNLYDPSTSGEINQFDRALTIANLETTVEEMRQFTDPGGEPILNGPQYLVVPPALEFTARQILTSTIKSWHYGADDEAFATAGPMPTTNVIAQIGLQLVIDPYLPYFDDDAYSNTWYLFAQPSDIAAIEVNRLVGHESPEIVMKSSDKVAVGGAPLGELSGDFATDNVFYRVRSVFGADRLDWRATTMCRAA